MVMGARSHDNCGAVVRNTAEKAITTEPHWPRWAYAVAFEALLIGHWGMNCIIFESISGNLL